MGLFLIQAPRGAVEFWKSQDTHAERILTLKPDTRFLFLDVPPNGLFVIDLKNFY